MASRKAPVGGLRAVKYRLNAPLPALGISFVAMRENRSELSEVIRLGLRLGAAHFTISGVQPHTAELRGEILHEKTLGSRLEPSRGWTSRE